MVTRNVRSTAIQSLRYVPLAPGVEVPGATGFLVVRMRTGQRYGYAVPKWVCGLAVAAPSKGRFYSRVIRGKFPVVKMEA